MAGFTSYEVDNDRRFQRALQDARRKVKDLTIPLTLISKDFYKSEKAIFQLQSPGRYPDLATATKSEKKRKVGFIYPILKRTGRLERSVTNPTADGSINQIANKDTLIIGTSVPYGVFHQSDSPRSKIPLRKFLFIGPEAPQFVAGPQKGRLQRWLGILDGFMGESLKEVGSVS